MRNLKRVLSLALALVMVLGMMVITTSAATFADEDKIENVEAVTVLNALKILEGDGTNFDPEGNLTREQAAKIITYVMLGKANADKLTAYTTFADVPATWWSAKYVSYCASLDIIAGYGDGNFGRNDNVTDVQFGKMLLVAMGYDATGYVGKDWATNISVDMIDAGLNVSGAITNTPITRDTAAAMALVALKAGTTTTRYAVEIGGDKFYFDSQNDALLYYAISDDASWVGIVEETTESLLEDVHGVACYPDGDAFGRPGTVYDSKSWKSALFFQDAPVLTYTSEVKEGTLYTELGKGNTYKLVEDGATTGVLSGIKSGSKTAVDGTGNGVLTEVYKTGKNSYTVVMVNTYIGTVDGYTPEELNDDGEIAVYESIEVEGMEFITDEFSAMDAKKHTVVLYTCADGELQSVEVAASEELTPTWCNDKSFKAAGTTYKYSENTEATIGDADVKAKEAIIVYFDNYGYVIGAGEITPAASDYVYVLDADTDNTALFGKDSHYAKLMAADGTVTTVEVDEPADALIGEIVTYVEDKDVYTLTKATEGTASGAIAKNQVTVAGKTAGDKTVYVVETHVGKKAVYTVYTGVTNLPEIKDAEHVVVATSKGKIAVCFVMGAELKTEASEKTVAFINGKAAYAYDVDLGGYYTQSAIVGGEITEILAKDKMAAGIYATIKTDNGLVTGGVELDENYIDGATGIEEGSDSIIKIGEGKYIYDDATAVYTVNGAGKIAVSSIDEIEADEEVTVYGYTTKGILTMIVIVG